MKWITLAVLAVVAGAIASDIRVAMNRSRQKRTMAGMLAIATRIEKGQPVGRAMDAWGHPMRIHRSGPHYSIQAACSDGEFDAMPPRLDGRPVTTVQFSEDVLLMDGLFVQFPEGVCRGDVPDRGPLGTCMSCHPSRIRRKAP